MWVDVPLEPRESCVLVGDFLLEYSRSPQQNSHRQADVLREGVEGSQCLSWTLPRNNSNHNTCFCRKDKDQGLETGTKQWPLSQDRLSEGEGEDPIL